MKRYVKMTVFVLAIVVFALSLCACAPVSNLIDKIKNRNNAPLTDVEKINESFEMALALGGKTASEESDITSILAEARKLDLSVEDFTEDGAISSGAIIVKDGMITLRDGKYASSVIKIYENSVFLAEEDHGVVKCYGTVFGETLDSNNTYALNIGVDIGALRDAILLKEGDLKTTKEDGVYTLSRDYLENIFSILFPDGIPDEIKDACKDISLYIDLREYAESGKIIYSLADDKYESKLTVYTTVAREKKEKIFTVTVDSEDVEEATLEAKFADDEPKSLDLKFIAKSEEDNAAIKITADVEYSEGDVSRADILFTFVPEKEEDAIIITVSVDTVENEGGVEQTFALDLSSKTDGEEDLVVKASGKEIHGSDESVKLSLDLYMMIKDDMEMKLVADYDTSAAKVKGGEAVRGTLEAKSLSDDEDDNFKIDARIVTEKYSSISSSYLVDFTATVGDEESEMTAKLYHPAKGIHKISDNANRYLQNADKIYTDYTATQSKADEIKQRIEALAEENGYLGFPYLSVYLDEGSGLYYVVEITTDEDGYVPVVYTMADANRLAFEVPRLRPDLSGYDEPIYKELMLEAQSVIREEVASVPGALSGDYLTYEYVAEYDAYWVMYMDDVENMTIVYDKPTYNQFPGLYHHEIKRESDGTFSVHSIKTRGASGVCRLEYYCEHCGISYVSSEEAHRPYVITSKTEYGNTAWEFTECENCSRVEIYIYNAGPSPVAVSLKEVVGYRLDEYFTYRYSGNKTTYAIMSIRCTDKSTTDDKYNIVIPDISKSINSIILGVETYYDSSSNPRSDKIVPHASLTLPETVVYINSYSFYENEFDAIILPKSLEFIGKYAFAGSKYLSELVISGNIQYILESALDGGSIKKIVIESEYLKSLGYINAPELECLIFKTSVMSQFTGVTNSKIVEFVIPDSVTSMPSLSNNPLLKKVIIGDGVTDLGFKKLENCPSLESVTLGASITAIGLSSFAGCQSLKELILSDTITDIGPYSFDGLENLCRVYPIAMSDTVRDGDVILPDSVVSIGTYAFAGCNNIKNVIISKYVTEISSTAFVNIELESITFKCDYTFGQDIKISADSIIYAGAILSDIIFGNERTDILAKDLPNATEGVIYTLPEGSTVNFAGTLEELASAGYVFDDTVTVNCEVEFE